MPQVVTVTSLRTIQSFCTMKTSPKKLYLIRNNWSSPRTSNHTNNNPRTRNLRTAQRNQNSARQGSTMEIRPSLNSIRPIPTRTWTDHKHKTVHNPNTCHRSFNRNRNLRILPLHSKSSKKPRLRIAETSPSKGLLKIPENCWRNHCSIKTRAI